MEPSKKVKGNYATAYKLSGSNRDHKALRLQRRSIEQKEQRFGEIGKRRNLSELSPLHENDNTIVRDKNYKDKTPVKATNGGNAKKCADRLEQLKKWKAEREMKRKEETQSKSNVFRTSKKMDYGDRNLFSQKSASKAGYVKPAPVTSLRTSSKPVQKAIPTTQKSEKSRTVRNKTEPTLKKKPEAPATRTRQKSGPAHPAPTLKVPRQTGRNVSKEVPRSELRSKPKQTKADTGYQRSTRSGRALAPAPSTRAPRQASNKHDVKTSQQDEESPNPDLTCVNTLRGHDGTFAPPEFSFNASSFVFKPLSPNSAAGFLFGNQDSTCTSFLETNPKRSSTPKRGSGSSQSSSNVDKVTEKCSDTFQLENTAVNVTGFIGQPLEKTSSTTLTPKKSPVKSPKSATKKSVEDAEVTTVSEKSDTHINEQEVTSVSKKAVRKNSRRSVVSSTLADSNMTEESVIEAPKQSKRTRRSVRASGTSGNSSESDSVLSAEDGLSNVSKSSRVTNMDEEVAKEEVTIIGTPKSTKKMVTISESTDVKNVSEDSGFSTKTPTPLRRSTRRRSVTIEAEESKPSSASSTVTPSRSARKSRRSVAVTFEAVAEVPESVPDSLVDSAAENDSVFEDEAKTFDVAAAGVKFEQNLGEEKKLGRKSKRNKSFGGFRLPSTDSVVLSAKRRGRKSMMPKSPEEWVNLLSNSPMIEMTRRRSKVGNTSLPALCFDIDLDESNSTEDEVKVTEGSGESEAGTSASEGSPANTSTSELGTSPAKVSIANTSTSELGTSPSKVSTANTSTSELGHSEVHDVTVNDVSVNKSKKDDTAAATVQVLEVSSTQKEPTEEKHDVPYFRQLLVSETDRLSIISEEWNQINDEANVSEEIHGQIRTTVGQAQLLMAQRFKQFRGLVDDCEFQRGEKETTCMDLQGFWDMIYFQVEDVDAKFADLKKLKDNKWMDDKPKPIVKKAKKVSKPMTSKPAVKSKFAAFRKQMQKQQKTVDSPVVKPKEEEKVFEVPGFFTVASPVRTPKAHCEGGTPRKATPASSDTGSNGPKLNLTSSADLLLKNPRPSRPRPSYIPAVPSPLLLDSTPQPRPARTCTQRTPLPKRLLDVEDAEGKSSPSKRARRSLQVQNTTPDKDTCHTVTEEPVSNKSDADFARLLQPMSEPQQQAAQPVNKLNDSFSKYLQPMSVLDSAVEKENSPKRAGRRRSSTLKQCPSKERRRSSTRAVHFDSNIQDNDAHVRLPHTPYNSAGLKRQKRVTRRSVSGTPSRTEEEEEGDDVFCTEKIDLDQNIQNLPAHGHRDPRPSLLFTPPELKRSPRASRNVPTAKLISFSP